LSTADLRKSDRAGGLGGGLLGALFQWVDLLALLAALPVFVLGGLPMFGYLAAALAWIVQRGIQVAIGRRAAASDDPRTLVGLAAGSMILRSWIVAGAVFGVGIAAGDDDGLAAAVLSISLFTVYFAAQLMLRPVEDGKAIP
jgi:hypothetical protein